MVDKIDVLDHGYVRYVKHMGDDLDPVNTAKVSFDKESTEFGKREARLLGFLVREEHTSVFRHSAINFEVYAPLLVARQWWKYAVASAHLEDQNGWNESSRRYITEEPTFYIPGADEWRSVPESRKQGSGPVLTTEQGEVLTNDLQAHVWKSVQLYEEAMARGACAEQARLFLPAYALYVRWRWTVSLGGLTHFLFQRLEHDAQWEIQQFARAVRDITADHFPVTIKSVLDRA